MSRGGDWLITYRPEGDLRFIHPELKLRLENTDPIQIFYTAGTQSVTFDDYGMHAGLGILRVEKKPGKGF